MVIQITIDLVGIEGEALDLDNMLLVILPPPLLLLLFTYSCYG